MDSRLDIRARASLARVGALTLGDRRIELPNILFVHSKRVPAPEWADISISPGQNEDGPGIRISDCGSIFTKTDIDGEAIPANIPYPHSIDSGEGSVSNDMFYVLQSCSDEDIKDARDSQAPIVVWSHCRELINRTKELSAAILRVRTGIGPEKVLYAPGMGLSHQMPLLFYLGIDLFDSLPLIEAARKGIKADRLASHIMKPKGAFTAGEEFSALLEHNQNQARDELTHLSALASSWGLREEVEHRATREAWMVETLRFVDLHHYEQIEPFFTFNEKSVMANHPASLDRPDIQRWRRRLNERYRFPAAPKVLLILPCSARKPYSRSRTHKAFANVLYDADIGGSVQELIITSPLGLVPRELELFYPAMHYDIPVTNHWSHDEKVMINKGLKELLSQRKFDRIIVHLPEDMEFIKEVIGGHIWTCKERPASYESLNVLSSILKEELAKLGDKVPRGLQQRQMMAARLRYQFGEGALSMMDGAELRGKYPFVKIIKKGVQMGMLVGERGMISLTLDGAKVLAEKGIYTIEVDTPVKEGNIFAIGVKKADPAIRRGDDVAVLHDGKLIGVGVAKMNPWQMVGASRGESVRIRSRPKE